MPVQVQKRLLQARQFLPQIRIPRDLGKGEAAETHRLAKESANSAHGSPRSKSVCLRPPPPSREGGFSSSNAVRASCGQPQRKLARQSRAFSTIHATIKGSRYLCTRSAAPV